MNDFIITSIIASVVLTILLNLLPLLFPKGAKKVQQKLEENARNMIEQDEDSNRPRVKVFFPWKAMLIGSIILTILVNLIGFFANR